MDAAAFQQLSHKIPQEPGIYKYYGAGGELLYVGKAKNLRKRVSSYFSRGTESRKTRELVARIEQIDFTIVNSEQDAFFLENALIKEHQPRFNIDLKDDKTYPYIVIKKEPFPRVFLTRKKTADQSEYLGPYTSVGKVRELLDFIRHIIPLRTCKLNLSEQQIRKGKYKVCLEYHLGNCKGPCAGLQEAADYESDLTQVRNLLKGNLGPVLQHQRDLMKKAVDALAFEKAELIRKNLDFLEAYRARSVIVNSRDINADVFALLREGNMAYVSCLMVQSGTIIQTHTVPLQPRLEESDEELLVFAIVHLRTLFNSNAPEIVVPFAITYPQERLSVVVPRGGDRKQLLELAQKNVNYFLEELRRKKMLRLEGKSEAEIKNILYQLQEDLQLSEVPTHIECFDNSNFQGSFPVSAMVCFRNGQPSKSDYRHFNVKTVTGINDVATMKEVVFRRYKRLLQEKQELPQLVIIDGGKGQLHAAMESIDALGLTGSMTVAGLAKNEEELFFPGDTESLKLDMNSDSLKLIRRIRDEVHRFGITHHRKKRSRETFTSELDQINGIGPQTTQLLMKTYKSVARIKSLSEEELCEIIGKGKAKLVWEYFHHEEGGAKKKGQDKNPAPF